MQHVLSSTQLSITARRFFFAFYELNHPARRFHSALQLGAPPTHRTTKRNGLRGIEGRPDNGTRQVRTAAAVRKPSSKRKGGKGVPVDADCLVDWKKNDKGQKRENNGLHGDWADIKQAVERATKANVNSTAAAGATRELKRSPNDVGMQKQLDKITLKMEEFSQRLEKLSHTSDSIQSLEPKPEPSISKPKPLVLTSTQTKQGMKSTTSRESLRWRREIPESFQASETRVGERLVAVMRRLSSSPVIVTTLSAEHPQLERARAILEKKDQTFILSTRFKWFRAMTVSSLTTVTMDPVPIVSFNVRRPSRTLDGIMRYKTFSIHILDGSESGAEIAHSFTQGSAEDAFKEGRKRGLFNTYLADGPTPNGRALYAPKIVAPSVMARLRCDIIPEKMVEIGDHAVVFASVQAATPSPHLDSANGLLYQAGSYRGVGAPVLQPSRERSDTEPQAPTTGPNISIPASQSQALSDPTQSRTDKHQATKDLESEQGNPSPYAAAPKKRSSDSEEEDFMESLYPSSLSSAPWPEDEAAAKEGSSSHEKEQKSTVASIFTDSSAHPDESDAVAPQGSGLRIVREEFREPTISAVIAAHEIVQRKKRRLLARPDHGARNDSTSVQLRGPSRISRVREAPSRISRDVNVVSRVQSKLRVRKPTLGRFSVRRVTGKRPSQLENDEEDSVQSSIKAHKSRNQQPNGSGPRVTEPMGESVKSQQTGQTVAQPEQAFETAELPESQAEQHTQHEEQQLRTPKEPVQEAEESSPWQQPPTHARQSSEQPAQHDEESVKPPQNTVLGTLRGLFTRGGKE